MNVFLSLLTIQLSIYSLVLLAIVKFDKRLVAKILIYESVNFDYFLVKNIQLF